MSEYLTDDEVRTLAGQRRARSPLQPGLVDAVQQIVGVRESDAWDEGYTAACEEFGIDGREQTTRNPYLERWP